MNNMDYFEKCLTETDRDNKLIVPSDWLGKLLPADIEPGAKTEMHVVGEWGETYTFRLKVRSPPKPKQKPKPKPETETELKPRPGGTAMILKYYRKPEFMAREWQAFVCEKGLKAGERVFFWSDKGRIRVKDRVPPRKLTLFDSTFLN